MWLSYGLVDFPDLMISNMIVWPIAPAAALVASVLWPAYVAAHAAVDLIILRRLSVRAAAASALATDAAVRKRGGRPRDGDDAVIAAAAAAATAARVWGRTLACGAVAWSAQLGCLVWDIKSFPWFHRCELRNYTPPHLVYWSVE